jgi:putative membrane protein
MTRLTMPAVASIAAVGIAGVAIVSAFELGPLSTHMARHIAVMNFAAPALAIVLVHHPLARVARPVAVWATGVLQTLLLWVWHAPVMQYLTMEFPALQMLMDGSLLLSGVGFWTLLLTLSSSARWQAIFLLLLTGKLSCLLGVLLIFAPRHLYTAIPHLQHHSTTMDLADQQLAGLLMITACPLSYVLAGVVLAAQMMADLARSAGARDARKPSVVV